MSTGRTMYYTDQVKHLKKLVKLDRPLLSIVSDDPKIDHIDDCVIENILNIHAIEERYVHINLRINRYLIKFVSYGGSNFILKTIGRVIDFLMKKDLNRLGRNVTSTELTRGLHFAQAHKSDVRQKGVNPVSFDSGVGYDSEDHDLAIALRYKAWVDASQHFETEEERLGTYFYFSINNTAAFLKEHSYIKKVINFGACYGIMEDGIASRCPNVKVMGVDRAVAIKNFNDSLFNRDNLEFIAADIQDVINREGDLSNTLFMFMRTAFIFSEGFMTNLFKLLGEKNIAAIVGIEPFGYIFSEGHVYKFSEQYQQSKEQRGGMMVHNYPYLCKLSGLNVIEQKYFLPMTRHGDFTDANRTYCFIACRS